jgi:hypothetical protein
MESGNLFCPGAHFALRCQHSATLFIPLDDGAAALAVPSVDLAAAADVPDRTDVCELVLQTEAYGTVLACRLFGSTCLVAY